MNMKLVEPLRELFKDEVRALGRELGLPDDLRRPPPVPRPGLAIRIPGESPARSCDILRKADAVYSTRNPQAGLYDAIWQAFAVLLPVQAPSA
jgi:GMP synthase (glutamine-hydrolysing)